MKKIAVTVAVLALGLAACDARTDENAVGNEAAVENAAAEDVNAATVDAGNAAENALDAASDQIENAGAAVENAADAVGEATENAAN
jgi:hypothetical protein